MLEVADKVDQVKFPFHFDKMSQKSLGSVWSCLSISGVSDGRSRANVTYRTVQDSKNNCIFSNRPITSLYDSFQFKVASPVAKESQQERLK